VVVTAELAADPAGLGVAAILQKPVDVDILLEMIGATAKSACVRAVGSDGVLPAN
jgi:hypothetical protein